MVNWVSKLKSTNAVTGLQEVRREPVEALRKRQRSSKYKYVSIEFNMALDQQNWAREAYSLLDYLGDMGGLLDILLHIGALAVEPVAMFTLKTTLLTTFFRFKEASK